MLVHRRLIGRQSRLPQLGVPVDQLLTQHRVGRAVNQPLDVVPANFKGFVMEVHLLYRVVEVLGDFPHFLVEVRLHLGHGGGEALLALLHLGKLLVQRRNVLLAALYDGVQDLRRFLRAVRQLAHQALVHPHLHGPLDVGRIGLHIGDLPLQRLNEAVDGGLGRAVQLVKQPQLPLNAFQGPVVALGVGRLQRPQLGHKPIHLGCHGLDLQRVFRLPLAIGSGRRLQLGNLCGVGLLGRGELPHVVFQRTGGSAARIQGVVVIHGDVKIARHVVRALRLSCGKALLRLGQPLGDFCPLGVELGQALHLPLVRLLLRRLLQKTVQGVRVHIDGVAHLVIGQIQPRHRLVELVHQAENGLLLGGGLLLSPQQILQRPGQGPCGALLLRHGACQLLIGFPALLQRLGELLRLLVCVVYRGNVGANGRRQPDDPGHDKNRRVRVHHRIQQRRFCRRQLRPLFVENHAGCQRPECCGCPHNRAHDPGISFHKIRCPDEHVCPGLGQVRQRRGQLLSNRQLQPVRRRRQQRHLPGVIVQPGLRHLLGRPVAGVDGLGELLIIPLGGVHNGQQAAHGLLARNPRRVFRLFRLGQAGEPLPEHIQQL